jgi:4'-phosphopantetheinyl transferase
MASGMAEAEGSLDLAGDEIHVWRAELDQPETTVLRVARTLSPDEQARAKRFCLDRVRTRFVVGRGLLRTILGRYLDRAPDRLRFTYGPRGKPALAPEEATDLRFNLSHSGGLALFAVARGREVGVDVERLRPMPRAERIAERFFSVPERTALKAVPAERRVEAFFTCWTRKEAYIKALGDGLAHPLDQFAVSLAPGEPPRLSAVGDANGREVEHWRLAALPPAPGYVAALAGRGQGWRLATRWWPLHS